MSFLRLSGGAVTAILAVVLFVVPDAVGAQEYPVETGTLVTDDAVVTPGEPLRVQGSGFEPGGAVAVTIESDTVLLTRTSANAAGAIDVTVVIPAQMPAGDHTVRATGPAPGGGQLVLSRTVTVLGTAALPRTGPDVMRLVVAGGGAVVAGGVVLAMRRRPD